MLSFEIINRGRRTVIVNAPQLQLPNKRTVSLMSADGLHDFPKRLNDGDTAEIRVQYEAIADGLRKSGHNGSVTLKPVVTDSTGKTYRGKKFEVDLDKNWWAKI